MKAQKIARELLQKHYNYYCTVYFDFIVEAVENTLDDIGDSDVEKIHAYIKENYI